MTTKVIWWGTGYVGKLGLAAVIDHPEYELAGLIINTPDKVGRDAGEILGRDPIGVTATNDPSELLAGDADAVAYFATDVGREMDAIADMARALRAGKSVVSCVLTPLIYPDTAPPELTTPLREACEAGGASLFVTGVEPGVFSDIVPMTLMGACARVQSVRVVEILDYSTFYNQNFMEGQGWGGPIDVVPPFCQPGILTMIWRAPLDIMAEGLGVKIDEVREFTERLPATRAIELPGGLGVIEKGTMGALRWRLEGIVDGQPRIVLEHFNRMAPDQAPDWPMGDVYRVEIKGNPDIDAEFAIRGTDGDGNTGGCTLSAWRAVTAIPAVCAARPGILTPFDLPLITGVGNVYESRFDYDPLDVYA